MFPYELDKKTKWPEAKAKAKYAEFHKQALTEFRASDSEAGIGQDGKVYSETENGFAIDWVKASKKHAGDDVINRTIDLWDEFCNQPQDSDAYTPFDGMRDRKRDYVGQKKSADHPAGPTQPQFAPQADTNPMRRKPGRPVGSRNRETLSV